MKPILIAVGAIVLVGAIVVAAVASRGDDADGSASASDSELAGVYDKCVSFMNEVTKDDNGNSPVDAEDYMDLGSDIRSVTISAPESGDMQDLYATIALGCYLGKLEAPSGVSSLVEGTTAMMGRQTEEWDHYRLTWSYHPDTSLAATLEDTSD